MFQFWSLKKLKTFLTIISIFLFSSVLFFGYPIKAQEKSSNSLLPCAWKVGQKAKLHVYISDEPIQTIFREADLVLEQEGIEFGSFDFSIEKSLNYTLPEGFAIKEPVFAHIYLTIDGYHPDTNRSPRYNPISTVYRRLVMLDKMPKPHKTSNLMNDKLEEVDGEPTIVDQENNLVAYWYPEINIGLVQDASPIDLSLLTPSVARAMSLAPSRSSYLPTLYTYEHWRTKDQRIILTTKRPTATFPLKISFNPIGSLKFNLLTQFDHSFEINEKTLGASSEIDKLKQMFIETNPYLLIITLIVSLIHSILDFLAFKNGTRVL